MQFGAYRVVEPVAKDARADVYLAVPDAGFASSVVLRVIPASSFENEAARAEFTRSVKLYATLSHSAVVQTYDLFSENGNLVVVMEYVEGTALDDFLETLRAMDTPMPDAAALFIGLRVVGALAAAHAVRDPTDLSLSPIVHGDVRPETILVPWDGYVRLADFRAAKTTTTFRARPGGVSRHAAPEVMREGRASTSSDVYSAALVVWELLTHRQAFPPSLGGAELMRALASPTIPRLATVRPDLPRKLVETLDRALEPRAEDRTVTAAQLLAVLRSSFVPEEGETWIIRTLAHIQAGPTIRRAPESAPLVTDADVEEALSADATQKRAASTSIRAMPDESQPIGLLAWSDDATTAAVTIPSTARLPPKMQKTAPMKNAPPLPPRAAPKSAATPAPPVASSAPLGPKARTTMAIAGGPPASPRPPSKPPPVPTAPPPPPAPAPHEGREITLALAAPAVAEALAPSTQKSARSAPGPVQAPPPAPPPPQAPPPVAAAPLPPPFATDPAPPPIMSVPPEIIHVPSPAVPHVEVWQPPASQQPPPYVPLPTVSIPRSVPPPPPKKTSSAVWLVPVGILVFGGLGVAAYAFRDRLLPPKVAITPPKPPPSASVAPSASTPIAVRTAAPVASAPLAPSASAALDASAPSASASVSPSASATSAPSVASAAPSTTATSKPGTAPSASVAAPVATSAPASDLVADATHCVMHTRDAQPGHRIYYDNRVVGETPASVVVRCGVHEVKLGSAGYLRKPDLPCGGELSLK